MNFILIPQTVSIPSWVDGMCAEAFPVSSGRLMGVFIDFNHWKRRNLPWLIKRKLKKIIAKLNKTEDDYIRLIQVATHFYFVAASNEEDIIYDSTTDFFMTPKEILCH